MDCNGVVDRSRAHRRTAYPDRARGNAGGGRGGDLLLGFARGFVHHWAILGGGRREHSAGKQIRLIAKLIKGRGLLEVRACYKLSFQPELFGFSRRNSRCTAPSPFLYYLCFPFLLLR